MNLRTRPFGNVGFNASEIGLGCWQLGGGDWGALDEGLALRILGAAADAGVNFFDTADVYGGGRSETLIGRFLKESPGRRIFVATKLGRTGVLYPNKYDKRGLREATEASLRRLGVEALDLTQLHCVPAEVLRRGDVFTWLRELKQEGKIRAFGASVETVEEGLWCLEQDGLASLQVIFNLFRQKPAAELLPRARAKGVGIIVRLPLASGVLAGNFTAATTFAATDHRTYNRDGAAFNVGETFAGLPFAKAVELAEALKAQVPAGWTMAQFAQRWILDHPAVSTVITGASRVAQVEANATVSGLPPLAEDVHAKLAEFYRREVAAHIRGPY
ncbi:MAG: aldo/keto reductase [Opitutaceae bacterium]|jgi:aryl-alcohol dehydrogenase-like predicted oxidoreductase|nr:aldo/keto reductase [Opitutaceae bacterium]